MNEGLLIYVLCTAACVEDLDRLRGRGSLGLDGFTGTKNLTLGAVGAGFFAFSGGVVDRTALWTTSSYLFIVFTVRYGELNLTGEFALD